MTDWKKTWKKVWYFIWEDNSIWSWIANIILAFVLIKFIVYPALGFVLQTSHPVVAVVSESMEHNSNFDDWWDKSNDKYFVYQSHHVDGIIKTEQYIVDKWYINNGIKKEDFEKFPFRNGFKKGDIMVLGGKKPQDIKIGDIIVFWSAKKDPIIHRVVNKWQKNNIYHFQTKGDNYGTNKDSIVSIDNRSGSIILDETDTSEEQIVGNAILRMPFLGYIKIWFVDFLYILRDFLLQKG